MRVKMIAGALCAAGALSLFGGQLPTSFTVPFNEQKVTEFTVEPQKGRGAYLAFSGRIDTPDFTSGSQPAVRILVNGVPLSENRLVNKGDYFHFRRDHLVRWFIRDKMTLVYYPWDAARKTLDKQFTFDFVFELDGLLKEGENRISWINEFKAFRNSRLEFKNVHLTYSNDFPVSSSVEEKAPRSYGAKELRHRASSLHRGVNKILKVEDDFQMASVTGPYAPRRYAVSDYRFSDNGAGVLKLKTGEVENTFTSSWRIGDKVLKLSGNAAASAELNVSRKIEKTPFGVVVSDTLTNRTGKDLPVIVDNAVTVDLDKLEVFRLAGSQQSTFTCDTDNLATRDFAMTPLVFMRYADSGFGVYLEDDRYRNQYSAIAVDDTLHLVNDLFYLAPNSSYTYVWKIYPIPDGNYYSLLNALRQDYELYQPIPGLFGFIYPFKEDNLYERYYRKRLTSPEAIREFFEDSGISIPCATPIMNDERVQGMAYGSEPSEFYDRSLDVPAEFLKAMRAAGVELPLLMYTDVHLVRTDGDFDFGRQSKWQERLNDSVIRNYFGNTVPYRTGYLYHVAARPDNAAGKQIERNIDTILDTKKFSGIFLDEWNHSNVRVAFNLSDGTTALLDHNGQIAHKAAIIPLYSKEFLVKTGKQVTDGGRVSFANQFDCLLDLMRLPLIHFAEPVAHEDCYLIRAAQASRTPLTLTCKRNTTAWSDVKYYLRYGIICCFYASRMYGDHVLKRLYPITIREIHPGVVIGEDRIFTNRSGKFSLGDGRNLTAYIYSDPKGLFSREVKGGSEIELTLDPEREVAVIIAE